MGGECVCAEKVNAREERAHPACGEALDIPRGKRQATCRSVGVAALKEQIKGGFLGEWVAFELGLCVEQRKPDGRRATKDEGCDDLLERLGANGGGEIVLLEQIECVLCAKVGGEFQGPS